MIWFLFFQEIIIGFVGGGVFLLNVCHLLYFGCAPVFLCKLLFFGLFIKRIVVVQIKIIIHNFVLVCVVCMFVLCVYVV